MKEGVGVLGGAVGTPVAPVFFPSLGCLVSDFIGNASPSKHEVTRQANFPRSSVRARMLSVEVESVC